MVLVAIGVVTALGVGLGVHVHRTGKRSPRFPSRPVTAVVLGARVHPDGTPSPALVDRVRVGLELLRTGQAQRLLLSGGAPDARPSEAATMARLALESGAQQASLLLEETSRSTFENAARCAELLEARGETEIILVSCDFHLARASAHFRGRGLTVWPVASVRSLSTGDRVLVTAKELIALLRRPWLFLPSPRPSPPRGEGEH